MKRGFNKFLSLMLALILVVGLMPAGSISFAAVGDTEVLQFKGAVSTTTNFNAVGKFDEYGLTNNPNWMYLNHQSGFGLHRIEQNAGLRVRVNSPTNRAATAVRFKFDGSKVSAGKYTITMKTSTIYDHGSSNRYLAIYLAQYDPTKTTAAEYISEENLLHKPGAVQPLLATTAATEITHTLATDYSIDDVDSEYVLVFDIEGKEYHINDVTFEQTEALATEYTYAISGEETEVAGFANYGVYELHLTAGEGEDLEGVEAYIAPKGTANVATDANKVLSGESGSDACGEKVFFAFKNKTPLTLHISGYEKVESATLVKVEGAAVAFDVAPKTLTEGDDGEYSISVDGREITPWAVSVSSSDDSVVSITGNGTFEVKKAGEVTLQATIGDVTGGSFVKSIITTALAKNPVALDFADLEAVSGAPDKHQAVIIPGFDTYGTHYLRMFGEGSAFSVYFAEYKGGNAADYAVEENLVTDRAKYIDGEVVIANGLVVKSDVPHILIVGDGVETIEYSKIADFTYVYDLKLPYAASGSITWADQYAAADETKNPNWMFVDQSADFELERNTNTNVFKEGGFKIANAAAPASILFDEAWTAFRLTTGETGIYDLSFAVTEAVGAKSADIYFAKYEAGKNDGAYYMTAGNLVAEESALSDIKIPGVRADGKTDFIVVIDVTDAEYNDFTIESMTLTKAEDLKKEYKYTATAGEMLIDAPELYGVYEIALKARKGKDLVGVEAYIAPEGTEDYQTEANKIIANAEGSEYVGEKLFVPVAGADKFNLAIKGYQRIEEITLRRLDYPEIEMKIISELLAEGKTAEAVVTVNGKNVLPWAFSVRSLDAEKLTVTDNRVLNLIKEGTVTVETLIGNVEKEDYIASAEVKIEKKPGELGIAGFDSVPGAPAGYKAVVVPDFEDYGFYYACFVKSADGSDTPFSVYFAEYKGGDASAYAIRENLVAKNITYISGEAFLENAFEVKNKVPHILIVGDSVGKIEYNKVGEVAYKYDFTKPYADVKGRSWIDQYAEFDAVRNPNWKFIEFSTDFADIRGVSEYANLDIRTNILGSTGYKLANSYDNDGKLMRASAWSAIHLAAPDAGVYDLSFSFGECYGAKKMKVYFAPYEEGHNDAAYYMTSENLKISGNPMNAKIENLDANGKTEYVIVFDVTEAAYNDFIITSINLKKKSELSDEYTYTVTGSDMEIPSPQKYGVYELLLAAKDGETLDDVAAYVAPLGTAVIASEGNKVFGTASDKKLFAAFADISKLALRIENAEKVESVTLKRIAIPVAEISLDPDRLAEGRTARAVVKVNGIAVTPWSYVVTSSDEELATVEGNEITARKSGTVTFEVQVADKLTTQDYSASIKTKIAESDTDKLPTAIKILLPSKYVEVGRPFEAKVADEDGNEITAGNIDIRFEDVDEKYLKFDGIKFTAKKAGKTTLRAVARFGGNTLEAELEVIILGENLLTRVAANGIGAPIAHGDFETLPASKPSESHSDVPNIRKLDTMWIFDHNYLYNTSRSYFFDYELVEETSPKYTDEKTNVLKISFDWTRTAKETFHLARVKTYPEVQTWTNNTGHSGYIKASKGKAYQLSGWFKAEEGTVVNSNIYASLGYYNDGDNPSTSAKEKAYQASADWSSGRVYINNLTPASASEVLKVGEWVYFETAPKYQNWPEFLATANGGEDDVMWINPTLDIATSVSSNPTYYIANLAINPVEFDHVDFTYKGDFSKAKVYDTFTTSITPYSNRGQVITRANVRAAFPVVYTTTDPYVAKVDQSGVITAVSNGSCEIYADMTVGDTTIRGVIPVEFNGLDVIFETVEGSISKDTLTSGETAEITQKFFYTDSSEYTDTASVRVYYESANPLVAEVDQNGVVTAKGSGTTTISVYAECGIVLAKDTVTVNVRDESAIGSVTITGPNTVEENFEIKLRAAAVNESGSAALAEEIIFDYADEASKEFIDVSANGVIRGLKPGIAGVIATFWSTSGSEMTSVPYEITVTPFAPVDKIIDFQLGKLAAGGTTANFKFHGFEVNEELTSPFLIADSHATKPDNFRWLPNGLFCNTDKNAQNHGNVKDADVAFNVQIDHAGWYLPRFTGTRYYNSTTRANIYFNREYLGYYDFYQTIAMKDGYPKKLNPIYLEAGINLLTFRIVEVNPEGNDQMYLHSLSLEYIDAPPGLSDVVVEAERTTLAAGETAAIETVATLENGLIYEFGFTHGYKDSTVYPENTPSDKAYTEYISSDETVAKVENGRLIAVGPGECTITATAHLFGGEMTAEEIRITVTDDTLDRIEISPKTAKIFIGKSVFLNAKAYLTNGEQIASRDYKLTSKTLKGVLTKESGHDAKFYAQKGGEDLLEATVTFNGKSLSETVPVTIVGDGFATVEATAFSQVMRPGSYGYDITFKCLDVNGGEMDARNAIATYTSSDESVVTVSESGHMTPVGVGTAEILVSVDLDGTVREQSLVISVRNGKTEKTYYTDEKAQNARENAKKYDWAKNSVKSTVKSAETYLEYVDFLYEMLPSEGIPRAGNIGIIKDRNDYATCRYCGTRLQYTTYGATGWRIDALKDPWKVKCPKCARRFPSNDFGSFFELGKDEHGAFNLQLAHNRHRQKFLAQIEAEYGAEYVTMPAPMEEYTEDWYKYYGYGVKGGYLTNDLYPEVTDKDPWTGEKTEGNGKWWCVDNGWGWRSGRMVGNDSEEKEPERSAFIALFNHTGLWNSHVKNAKQAYYYSLYDSALAYVYTGEKKYARTVAILLDRIADFYPDYDLNAYYKIYRNSNEHGKQGGGKILGNIHEPAMLAKIFPIVYDAVFDIYEDPEVLDYLTEKAIKYNLTDKLVNGRVTPETLRLNVERNIFLEFLPAVKTGDITGNFGFFQNLLVKTAIVIDDPVSTKEILDFTMQAGMESGGYGHKSTRTWTACTGGNVLAQIINLVDRDGYGDEVSLPYNSIWTSSLLTIAEDLIDYAKIRPENVEPEYNLLQNPKYIKMLKMYYPTVVSGAWHANIGDASDVGRRDPKNVASGNTSFEKAGFEATGDPMFAQLLYQSNGRKVDGLKNSIFTKDPEAIQDKLEKAIEQYGEIDYSKSQLLSGYGYASLISGNQWMNTTPPTNTLRTFWMYFGGGQGHRHPDRLNIGIDFYGYDFSPEFGYPETVGVAAGNINKKWYSGTLSHNTVMVDETNQDGVSRPSEADILHFDDSGDIKLMDVDAPLSYREKVEIYRRTLISIDINDTDTYAVDFFRVKGGNEHVYSFHGQSEKITFSDNLTFVEQPFGTYAGANIAYGDEVNYTRSSGYNFLYDVRRASNPGGNFTADFKIEYLRRGVTSPDNLGMKLTMLNRFDLTEVASAMGNPPQHGGNPEKFEYLLAKREGEDLDSLFTSVIEPYQDESQIAETGYMNIARADGRPITEQEGVNAISVTLKNGRRDIVVYATDKNSEYIISELNGEQVFRFKGFVGVYTLRGDGDVAQVYLHDGTMLDDGNDYSFAEGENEGEITGRVKDYTKGLAFESFIDLTTDDVVDPKALEGKIINVQTDDTQNGVYRICGAEKTADGYRISIGDVTLVRSLRDAVDLSQGYVYNINPGEKFMIPLTSNITTAPTIGTIDGKNEYSTNVGSTIKIKVEADSSIGLPLTFDASGLPRGAMFDEEKMEISWKPTKTQLGNNLVSLTVSDGTFTTSLSFIIKVLGSTSAGAGSTASKNENAGTSDDNAGSGSAGGGGGGGGGGGMDIPTEPTEPETPAEPEVPTTPEIPAVEGFIDLGNHSWAADAIKELADAGIIKGTSETTYAPAANITRADFAILLVRAFKLESDNEENFADVEASDYFAKELAVARNTGIVGGIGDNKYAPRKTITRQDMMVIVYRVLEKLNIELKDGEADYPDFDKLPDYAKDAVRALIANGLVNGKSGLIAGGENTTRAEVAVLIKRILDFAAKK